MIVCLSAVSRAGAGKTTLATKLAEKMNLPVFYEPVIDNVYLDDFYKDPARYGFPLQVCECVLLVCMCCVNVRESVFHASVSDLESLEL